MWVNSRVCDSGERQGGEHGVQVGPTLDPLTSLSMGERTLKWDKVQSLGRGPSYPDLGCYWVSRLDYFRAHERMDRVSTTAFVLLPALSILLCMSVRFSVEALIILLWHLEKTDGL